MAGKAFIYSNIPLYRLMMNLLYKGRYRKRFGPVCELIQGKSVTELCFGDTIVADYCKKKGIRWQGYDINPGFVERARSKGFKANVADIMEVNLPSADTFVISGSLYHFHSQLEMLLIKMLVTTSRIIISEPVHNLSSRNGIIGKLAKGSGDVNGKEMDFRYNEEDLLSVLNTLSQKLNFKYEVKDRISKDIIILITQ